MTSNTRLARLNRTLPGLISLGALLAALIYLAVSYNKTELSSNLAEKEPSVELAVGETDQLDSTETDSKQEVANEDLNSNLNEFEMQELDQLSSPFTKETVLKLNQIVGRSLAVVEEFDRVRRESDADSTRIGAYEELSATADKARLDMDAASVELRASGEQYNEAVFAAMVRFVNEVDDEIRSEADQFNVVQNLRSEN